MLRVLSNIVLKMISVSARIPWRFRTSLLKGYPLFKGSVFNGFPLCKGPRGGRVSADEFFKAVYEIDGALWSAKPAT